MTQDVIIEMARKAGFQTGEIAYQDGKGAYPFVRPNGKQDCLGELERFTDLVSAKYEQKIQDLEDLITELQERQA